MGKGHTDTHGPAGSKVSLTGFIMMVQWENHCFQMSNSSSERDQKCNYQRVLFCFVL